MRPVPRGAALVAVALLGVLLVVGILLLPPSGAGTSSQSSGPQGQLALYDWLDGLGYPVSRVNGGYDLTGVDTLISSANSVPLSARDVATTVGFLNRGGTLILATGATDLRNSQPLLAALGITGATVDPDSQATPARLHEPFGAGVPVPLADAVTMNFPPSGRAILIDPAGDVGAVITVGAGRAIVIGSDYPLSNSGLARGGSAGFVLALVQAGRGGRIAFDDYHHGTPPPAATPTDPLASVPPGSPIQMALILAVVAVMLGLITWGRRIGPPQPSRGAAEVPDARPYVHSMALLYRRARHRGAVAAQFADEMKRRVGPRFSADPAAPDDQFVAAVGAVDAAAAETIADVLHRARGLAAGSPDDSELVALAGRVDAVEQARSLAQWAP